MSVQNGLMASLYKVNQSVKNLVLSLLSKCISNNLNSHLFVICFSFSAAEKKSEISFRLKPGIKLLRNKFASFQVSLCSKYEKVKIVLNSK